MDPGDGVRIGPGNRKILRIVSTANTVQFEDFVHKTVWLDGLQSSVQVSGRSEVALGSLHAHRVPATADLRA